MFPLAAEYSTS
jgi:S-adenosylmethionine:tRNA-ribosyltransferase-isomerase (queuine synthetase)